MTNVLPSGAPADASAGADVNAAGDALRAAREAAGLSIEDVAQHLKLAPRQVRALEDGDYAVLPGRTFVRGFARNYARLLQLDADAVVAALPDATVAPALDKPALGSTAHAVGEIDERPRTRSTLAWPLLIVALVALAALIDVNRSHSYLRSLSSGMFDADPLPQRRGAPAASGTVTPLRNPLATPEAPATDPMPPKDTPPLTPPGLPAPASSPAAGNVPPAASPSPAAPAANATLVIDYRASSWTDVRDANGQRLLVGTMPAGSVQTVTGVPPFDVTLGNVSHTTVTWRGATVDTSAYHKQNVARLRLE